MKKVIKEKRHEEAIYFSDFSGKPFGAYTPPVTLKIEFSYGSIYDGSGITLHLDDKDIGPILELIKNKLNPDCKKQLRENLSENKDKLNESIECKDVASCEIYASTDHLLRTLIGEESDSTKFISEDRDRG